MEKILTISIAAYNVESYIEETLSSLLNPDIIDDLEIFIIDDGGKDNTLSIAKNYEEKFPNSIHAIHKENGGYGSTVNYSIEHATGKFFKLLDGDDWFEKDGIVKLVHFLKSNESDIVIIPYYRVNGDNKKLVVEQSHIIVNSNVDSMSRQNDWIGMHAICYKTSILKKCGLKLPEHIFYTDAIYSIEPIILVKIVSYVNFPVYCYRLGNNGQTISAQSMVRNLDKLYMIEKRLLDFCTNSKNSINYGYIKKYVAQNSNVVARVIMLKDDSKNEFIEFDNLIKSHNIDVYNMMTETGKIGRLIQLLRCTKYFFYRIVQKVIIKHYK